MSKLDYKSLTQNDCGNLSDEFMTRIQKETKAMRHQKEIAVTRAYLRFLEQGYTAQDLVIHLTPMNLVETEPNVFCLQQGITLRHKHEPYYGHEPVDDACEKARKINEENAVGRDGFEPS